MFKTKEEMIKQVEGNVRGGPGEITRIKWPEALPPHTTVLATIVLKPGDGIGYHAHDENYEIYYTLSGELEYNDNGSIFIGKAGDALITGGGQSHAVTNRSDGEASFLAIVVE